MPAHDCRICGCDVLHGLCNCRESSYDPRFEEYVRVVPVAAPTTVRTAASIPLAWDGNECVYERRHRYKAVIDEHGDQWRVRLYHWCVDRWSQVNLYLTSRHNQWESFQPTRERAVEIAERALQGTSELL